MYLFSTRVKSPQPPVDREEAEEKDEDTVSLDQCESGGDSCGYSEL